MSAVSSTAAPNRCSNFLRIKSASPSVSFPSGQNFCRSIRKGRDMKNFLIAASILSLATVPAHAQLLGGGGITGGLGSSLDLSGTLSRTSETVRSTTEGSLRGSAQTRGEQSVDRRSGRVKANRSANADGSASATQIVDAPILPMGASAQRQRVRRRQRRGPVDRYRRRAGGIRQCSRPGTGRCQQRQRNGRRYRCPIARRGCFTSRQHAHWWRCCFWFWLGFGQWLGKLDVDAADSRRHGGRHGQWRCKCFAWNASGYSSGCADRQGLPDRRQLAWRG